MAQNKPIHPAAKALSYGLDDWEQRSDVSGWYFTTVGGRLTAQELDYDGSVLTTYSVDLADIPFTKHDTN